MHAFAYHRPETLAEAAALLSATHGARLLAGGHSLLPAMKQRQAAPASLIDLSRIPGLREIERAPEGVTIGALTTHAEVAASPVVREALPSLVGMMAVLGDPAVRHRGTLGGAVAANDPTGDYAAACVALDAAIVTTKRVLPADGFFTGPFTTALEPDEIVTQVAFPTAGRAAYQKFRNPASRYALVGVFVAERDGAARVAVTGAGRNGVFRWAQAETALTERFAEDALDGIEALPEGLASDIHGDAQYRAHLIGIMTRRAVRAAVAG